MTALARKLQSRGHEVVFIGVPDIDPVIRAADLDFVSFCEDEYRWVLLPEAGAGLRSCKVWTWCCTRSGN
jgi:hypothetical protein